MIRTLFLTVAVLVLSGLSSIHAQTDKAKKLDDLIPPLAEAGQFAGVVVASENGSVIYEKAFGMANAEFKIPNDKSTRIGIASITKLMTAVIRERLIAQKRLAMEDKLSKFIPDFPNGDKITVQMLSDHRSGIPHRVMPPEQESVAHTIEDMITRIKAAKLAFEPGTARLYSSGGYTVLARVLEVASGKSYAQLLQEHVFGPAKMQDSLDYDGEIVMERKAQDYFLSPTGVINAPVKDYSFLVGAGSVYGTAADTHKFGLAIVEGTYGPEAKARLIGTNPTVAGSGSTNGHRSYVEVEKDKKYGYAVLANIGAGTFDVVQRGVRDIMMGKDVAPPTPIRPKVIEVSPAELAKYIGQYRTADGTENNVHIRNGGLYASDIRLYPTAPGCFFEYRFFGTVCFVSESGGPVKNISWKGTGFELTFVKQ